jgi:carbamoyl-phosphate synthase large subunit
MRANKAEARERWNIIASDADPFSWGLYIADQAVILPFANHPQYMDSLLRVIEEYNIDAVIPGSEPEVNVLSQRRHEVPVPVICNQAELMPLMMDKFAAAAKLRELGLPVIPTYPASDWRNAIAEFGFPLVVKPTVGTGGSRGLNFVVNEEEMLQLLPQLPESGKYCVQPYVGTGDDEYTVGVLTDSRGKMVDSIVMRRKLLGLSLLHNRNYEGKTYALSSGYSQGFFIRDTQIQEFCENLALKLGSTGPLNIQLRKSGNDIYAFEIHPRFSGTTTMRADVGFNEPDALLRNVLFGEELGRFNYQSDVAVIRAFEHVVVPISEMAKS